MSQPEKSPMPHLRVINPLDWMRLLWWGLVTPDTLKAYQKVHGKKGHKRVAGALISTLLWSPMFIVMSGTVINNQLIRVYVVSPIAPIVMMFATGFMWLITGFLIAWLDKADDDASYNPNNVVPFGIGALFAYITLEGFIGGAFSAFFVIVMNTILVATCDTLGKNLKVNSEGMIGVGLLTGVFFVTGNQLVNGGFGIPFFVANENGFGLGAWAILVVAFIIAFLVMGLITLGIEWVIKNVRIGGRVMVAVILSTLVIVMGFYYFGAWRIFSMPLCAGC